MTHSDWSQRLTLVLSTQFALLTSRHFIPVCSTFLACQQVRDVQPEASLYTFLLATAKILWAGSLLAFWSFEIPPTSFKCFVDEGVGWQIAVVASASWTTSESCVSWQNKATLTVCVEPRWLLHPCLLGDYCYLGPCSCQCCKKCFCFSIADSALCRFGEDL